MKILAVFFTAVALSVSGAAASPVTLQKQFGGYDADSYFGPNGGRGLVSNITNRPVGTFYAGGIRVKDATDPQNVQNLIIWCLDVAHNLNLSGVNNFNTTTTPFSPSQTLSTTTIAKIESLFSVSYKTLDLTSNSQSAGFQLALWELLYETGNSFNVGSGTWSATSSTVGAIAAANGFLNGLGNAITQAYKFTYYQASPWGGQNMVGVTPVPLPAAALLLGSGLVGLFAVGRRKRKVESA